VCMSGFELNEENICTAESIYGCYETTDAS